jgi:hypothetical protein
MVVVVSGRKAVVEAAFAGGAPAGVALEWLDAE